MGIIKLEIEQVVLGNGYKEFYVRVLDKDGDVVEVETDRLRDGDMNANDILWRYMQMFDKLYWRLCE